MTDKVTGSIMSGTPMDKAIWLPHQAPIRGRATVELFDAVTGRKKDEIVSDNAINTRWISYMYNKFFGHALVKQLAATNDDPIQKLYDNSNTPARCMYLTDYNGGEDAHGTYWKGNVVGWADTITPYSGESDTRGTINTGETTSTSVFQFTLHNVVDFPTHAANGTFRSIYMLPYSTRCAPVGFVANRAITDNLDNEYMIPVGGTDTVWYAINTDGTTLYRYDITNPGNPQQIAQTDVDSKYIYYRLSDNVVYELRNDRIRVYSADLQSYGDRNYSTPLEGTLRYGFIQGDTVYLVSSINGMVHFRSARLSDGQTIANHTHKTTTLYDAEYCIPFGGKRILFGYGLVQYSGVMDYCIYSYDFATDTIVNLSAMIGRFIYVYTSAGMSTAESANAGWQRTVTLNLRQSADDESVVYITRQKTMWKGCVIPYFSHVLLPKAVTKTSSSTMKIQYDYTVEKQPWFA